MNRLRFGIIAGLAFAIVDVLPMFAMSFSNKAVAVCGAFVNRFAIGFIIPQFSVGTSGAIRGVTIGLLLSVPDALITGAWMPIIGTGVVGGLIIGLLVARAERRSV